MRNAVSHPLIERGGIKQDRSLRIRRLCLTLLYRNVFSVVPKGKVAEVAMMLKAIHACEDRESALQKAQAISEKLEQMKLPKAADKVRTVISETLTYYAFPARHWRKLRTNNPLERIMLCFSSKTLEETAHK